MTLMSRSGPTRLNPLSIGSVFPTKVKLVLLPLDRLNPLSIGSVFPTKWKEKETESILVLIPFLSGLFFQPRMDPSWSLLLCLNPLSIGSVFPTQSPQGLSGVTGVLIPFLSGLFFQLS